MYTEVKQTEKLEFGVEKGSLQGSSKEYMMFMLRRLELPSGFQGRVFKGKLRERVQGT